MTDQVQGTARVDELAEGDAMLEQVAGLRARAAIARWKIGAPALSDRGGMLLRTSPQARWFKRMEQNFERWLLEGGLQQDESAVTPPVICIE